AESIRSLRFHVRSQAQTVSISSANCRSIRGTSPSPSPRLRLGRLLSVSGCFMASRLLLLDRPRRSLGATMGVLAQVALYWRSRCKAQGNVIAHWLAGKKARAETNARRLGGFLRLRVLLRPGRREQRKVADEAREDRQVG